MTTRSFISVISAIVISVAVLIGIGVLLTNQNRPTAERTADKHAPGAVHVGVVRVSYVEGTAVIQRGESHVQTNAVRNAPMLPGDFISTGDTSRAELQFDGYTAVRLGGSVQARIVNDGTNNRSVQLAGGTIEIGMVRDAQTMEVDTPSVTVRTRRAGDSRISIADDGSSWITARSGGVDVVTPQRTYALDTGRTFVARGPASNPSVTDTPQVAFDSFDDFNAQRDKTMLAALNASPNLNPVLAGYDDLTAYGQWQAVAGYGQSWVPNEPAGWVPYRNGSWAWEGSYGWTWIGSEPWGWTPYHYGNWFYCGCGTSGWAWLPPSPAHTPAWSPALVGFFQFDAATSGGYNNCGGNYGYAPGSYTAPAAQYRNAPPEAAPNSEAPAPNAAAAPYGEGGPSGPSAPAPYGYGPGYPPPSGYAYPYIGWVPIAPYEPFYPWYPGWGSIGFAWGFPATSFTNITNITNITRIYRNFRHGGATAVTTRHFRHGTVSGNTVPVTARDIGRHFRSIHGTVPIAPTRNNLAFSHGTVHAPVKFSKMFNSARFAPDRALATRNSFAHQQKAVAQAVHPEHVGHVTARAPVRHANAPVARVSAPTTRTSAPETHANAFQSRGNRLMTRANPVASHRFEAAGHDNAPVTRENAPVTRENAPSSTRENFAPTMRENGTMRESSAESRPGDPGRGEIGPSTPWDRFDQTRGEGRSAAFSAGSSGGATMERRDGDVSAPREDAREERAPSDSWGRFSTSRGESYGSMRNPYAERGSTPSYGREMPSYSRGSYSSPYTRESYPSYPRGSYASPYSRESYPSYSRGSYPSYSRGSYPSYSRGSYGSAPSYPRGNPGPSHSSGSAGGGGGGGGRHGGGGRPPQ